MAIDQQDSPVWPPARAAWSIVGAITLLALVLRVLAAQGGLWLDEAWSASFARQSATPLGLILNVHHDNNHLLNTLWLQLVGFGAPPLVQRGLAIVTGTLMVPVAAWIARRWGAGAMAVTALLFAVSPIMVTYGSEARGYAPMMLALLVATGLVLDWLDAPEGTQAPRRALAWAMLFGGLAQLTMVFGLAALIGTAWWTLCQRQGWRAASMATVRVFWPAGLALAAALAVILVPAWLAPQGLEIGSYTPFSWADWSNALSNLISMTLGLGVEAKRFPLTFGMVVPVAASLTPFVVSLIADRRVMPRFIALALIGLPLAIAVLHIGNAGYPRYYLLSAVAVLFALGSIVQDMRTMKSTARGFAMVIPCLCVALSLWTDATLIAHSRGDPLKAVALIPPGITTLWTPEARDTAVIESAAAASHRTLNPVTAPCPAAPYAFIEAGLGEPSAALPPPCPGARYVMAGQGETYGLSGANWWLYRRVR